MGPCIAGAESVVHPTLRSSTWGRQGKPSRSMVLESRQRGSVALWRRHILVGGGHRPPEGQLCVMDASHCVARLLVEWFRRNGSKRRWRVRICSRMLEENVGRGGECPGD